MYSLILLGCTSFVLSLLLTPLCRNLFFRCGWVDVPDQDRKLHSRPVPRAGGLAIGLSFAGSVCLLLVSHLNARSIITQGMPLVISLLPAVLVVFVTGLLDDVVGLKPWQKLSGQLGAASLAVWGGGLHIHSVANSECAHWWIYPLTTLWLVGCSNALNLIDGLDGLAAGIGLFAALTMLVAALIAGNVPLGLATAPVAGALLGFLRYNFHTASVFLGDCGSLLIGFLLGCYGVVWCSRSESVFGMAAPVMVLAVPVLDTSLAIVRRFLRRLPVFQADRAHIHHVLLARGFTDRRVVLLLYGICSLGAGLSLLQTILPARFGPLTVLVFCGGVWFGVNRLDYIEFALLRNLAVGGHFRGLLNAHISLGSFRKALGQCSGAEECWEVILKSSVQFGFSSVRLKVNGDEFIHKIKDSDPANEWTVRIALPDSGYLNLSRDCDSEPSPAVAQFADTLGAMLREKFAKPHANPPRKAMVRSAVAGR